MWKKIDFAYNQLIRRGLKARESLKNFLTVLCKLEEDSVVGSWCWLLEYD